MTDSKRLPTLCLDFDGVIHAYTSGWKGATVISDGPVPGAAQFISEAVEHFDVQVYSSRSHQPGGITTMSGHLLAWLNDGLGNDYGWRVWKQVSFPTHKPPAMVTLDDRALTFSGTWPSIESLLAFVPWNKGNVTGRAPGGQENPLVSYAREELLRIRNPYGDDLDKQFEAMVEADVLTLVEKFSDQGHSGGSAATVVAMLARLLAYRPISPLTGADDEWTRVSDDPDIIYQNKRYASVFKRADGTAYDIDAVHFRDPDGCVVTNPQMGSRDITFPYEPETVILDRDADGNVVQPVVPKWAVWWQGSGQRGDHVMVKTQSGLGYGMELAYVKSEYTDPESGKRHEAVSRLVHLHNDAVDKLSARIRELEASLAPVVPDASGDEAQDDEMSKVYEAEQQAEDEGSVDWQQTGG